MDTPSAHSPREATLLSLVPKGSVGGASIATVGAMNHNDAMAVGGFVLAVLGFLVNVYFKVLANRREADLHAAQLAVFKKE